MLKLISHSESKSSRSDSSNLRTVESEPNFALPQNTISDGVFANLKYLLTARAEKTPPQRNPVLVEGFRTTFVENLREFLRPLPRIPGSSECSLSGRVSPGVKLEPLPLYASLLSNIREYVTTRKLSPLDTRIALPEIWRKHKRLSVANLTSLMLHVSLTAVIIALTVRQVTTVEAGKPATVLIAPFPRPAFSPSAPQFARAYHIRRKSFFSQGKLIMPVGVPKAVTGIVAKRKGDDVAAPDVRMGVEDASPAGLLSGVLGGPGRGIAGEVIRGGTGGPEQPPSENAKPRILRIESNLRGPKAIYAPQPDFPVVARNAHISGSVILDAIIDERGTVVKLRPVSGSDLLCQSALTAVAHWRFEPTYLDGRPVAVEMEVKVTFHLKP